MEELFLAIYTKNKIKFCAACLHTDDDTKLCSMQNYSWVFTSLFTNLYLTNELQSSWVCSWCIHRLNNAKKLLENFRRAQELLSELCEDITHCKTAKELNKDILCNEINELKLKSRLDFSSVWNSYDINDTIIYVEKDVEIKNETSDNDNDYQDELDSINNSLADKSIDEQVIKDDNNCDLETSKLKQNHSKKSSRKSKKNEILVELKSTLKNEMVDSKIECFTKNVTVTSQYCHNIENHDDNIGKEENKSKDNMDVTKEIETSKTKSPVEIEQKYNQRKHKKFKKGKKNLETRSYLPHLPRRQCPECDRFFIKEIALLNHLKRKHKRKYPCEQCNKIYQKEEHLKTHLAKVHEEKTGIFECDLCSKKFKHRLNIVKHMIKHEKYGKSLREIERTVCDHCGKICSRHNIKSHLVKHSNVKEHHCTLCSASFKIAATLENHIKRRHKDPTVEKIFACEQCGRKFYDSTQVKYHMISIHSFQGHECPVCSKCFPTKGKSREHVRRVHEKVRPVRDKQCEFCDKVFSTRRMLQHHRYTHTGEKPYKCDICTSAYNQKHCLKIHQIRAHNIEKPKSNIVKLASNVSDTNIQQKLSIS